MQFYFFFFIFINYYLFIIYYFIFIYLFIFFLLIPFFIKILFFFYCCVLIVIICCIIYISIKFISSIIISITLIGLILVSCSCFRYFDLKKIIAFSSILHLNLSLISLFSLNSLAILAGIIICISHSFSSLSLFLIISIIYYKSYSRYLDTLFFIDYIGRNILILYLLANISFPGSLNFIKLN